MLKGFLPLLDKGLDASKNVVRKTGEYWGYKIADAITKSNDVNIEKQGPVVDIIIPSKKEKKCQTNYENFYKSETL